MRPGGKSGLCTESAMWASEGWEEGFLARPLPAQAAERVQSAGGGAFTQQRSVEDAMVFHCGD